jgi:hypothetical protein
MIKNKKMSLVEFHRQVTETQAAQKQKHLLSDRLKSKSASMSKPVPSKPQPHHPRTAASVAGAKEVVNVNANVNLTDFPSLSEYEPPELVLSGAWANGIQPILDAKDLPDPNSVAEQKRRKERRRKQTMHYRDYERAERGERFEKDDRDDREDHGDDGRRHADYYDEVDDYYHPPYDRQSPYREDSYRSEGEPVRGYGIYTDVPTSEMPHETWDL